MSSSLCGLFSLVSGSNHPGGNEAVAPHGLICISRYMGVAQHLIHVAICASSEQSLFKAFACFLAKLFSSLHSLCVVWALIPYRLCHSRHFLPLWGLFIVDSILNWVLLTLPPTPCLPGPKLLFCLFEAASHIAQASLNLTIYLKLALNS